jgi:uncharacterized protein
VAFRSSREQPDGRLVNLDLGLWQWVLAGVGAAMVGLAKTGIAGLGVLAVAIFATVLPARESVGILLVILIFTDFVAVGVYRRDASWPHLLRLFPWAGAGVLVGAAAFGGMNDALVRMFIGGILIGLVVLQLLRRTAGDLPLEENPNRGLVAITGLAAGFTTMVANAAGPLMVLYLLAMRLPKFTFVGTAAWFFLVLNLFKVPFSVSLGLITPASLVFSLKLVPVALLGALSGRWIITHMNQRMFEGIALLLTLLAGVRMLVG